MVLLVVRWNARLSDGRSRSNELDGCNLKEKHEKPTSRTNNQCRSESNDWQTNVEGKNYYKIWLKIKWIWRMHLVEYSTNICLFNRRWYSIGCIFENPLYNKYSFTDRPIVRPTLLHRSPKKKTANVERNINEKCDPFGGVSGP